MTHKPTTPALQLDWYFLLDLHAEMWGMKPSLGAESNASAQVEPDDVDITTTMLPPHVDATLPLSLLVTLTDRAKDRLGCNLSVALVGQFSVPRESEVSESVLVNAFGILFGAVREIAATVMGRGPGGPFLLPIVDFNEVLRRKPPIRPSVAQPS